MDDLAVIAPLLRGRRIVAAGEATHGTREFSRMKHRLFRYLVEEHGFTVLALEASMPNCRDLDHYVAHGQTNAKQALEEQGFWTLNTQEVLDLVNWMRKWNAENPSRPRLRVIGIDMQRSGAITAELMELDQGLKRSRDWIAARDSERRDFSGLSVWGTELAEDLTANGRLDDAWWATMLAESLAQSFTYGNVKSFLSVQGEVAPKLPEMFEDAKALLTSLTDASAPAKEALQFIADHSNKLVDLDAAPRADLSRKFRRLRHALHEAAQPHPAHREKLGRLARFFEFLDEALWLPENALGYRDYAMAENAARISRALPGSRVFVWAHNGHVMDWHFGGASAMGSHLRRLEPATSLIGFSFGEGSFVVRDGRRLATKRADPPAPGSWEELFEQLTHPISLVPTSRLTGERTLRTIGAEYLPEFAPRTNLPVNLSTALDVVIHFRLTTPAKSL